MTARVAGALLMALGAALAALPAFGWYSAPPVGAPTHASGFAGAGQLWALPLVGAMTVLSGAALVSARPEGARDTARRVGVAAALGGAVALGLALWAAADPRLELTAALPGGRETVPATTTLEAAAIVTPFVAGAILLLGLGIAWAGRRR